MKTLSKILIANRGEIAVRVIRTARSLGYRTVAVYSDADANAMHVREADEAVHIGPAAVSASYLNQGAIMDAITRTGADAVHPGYGFLSENAGFANRCEEAGIVFIGPPTGAIELMGSKRRSKIAMQEAGVPVVPGFEEGNATDEALIAAAQDIGFPLMVKASAGGGGRGMRLVHDPKHLAAEIKRARSEALTGFGDDELILEKAIIEPRHIEIQVFADSHGNAVYLGERDCSIQRRHQKVVEEAPSPFMTQELREAMGEAAVKAALACDYRGAGTVEFLVDKDRNFYFLEMNTRLQVEHPVTELITGQDLVAWQIQVAAGRPLPLRQQDIDLNGHAIEVRLYAEDPAENFTPQTGQLLAFQPAEGDGIRYDNGVEAGDTVSPFYDPMLAKVIAFGADREEARRRLLRALEETVVFGVTTNRHFLSRIIAHPSFAAGEATTAFLDTAFADDESLKPAQPGLTDLALAAAILGQDGRQHQPRWSNSLPSPVSLTLESSGSKHGILVTYDGVNLRVTKGEERAEIQLLQASDDQLCYIDNGIRQTCQYHRQGNHLYLQAQKRSLVIADMTHAPAGDLGGAGSGTLKASMDGAITDVLVGEGAQVQQGDTLVILEAMKMEHPIKADCNGTVRAIHISQGQQVKRHQLLVEIEPEDTNDGQEASA
ncbi:MAG: acetyl/propionyl/methylcrotonyl-CoA carboxylase subunit alpha [Marinobacter sp.]|nr:acetyl/propionyl/methylcrotonyl-CoA carboxylase subunit alpha [Marinobacter sp.]